jgi:hypothetical protein
MARNEPPAAASVTPTPQFVSVNAMVAGHSSSDTCPSSAQPDLLPPWPQVADEFRKKYCEVLAKHPKYMHRFYHDNSQVSLRITGSGPQPTALNATGLEVGICASLCTTSCQQTRHELSRTYGVPAGDPRAIQPAPQQLQNPVNMLRGSVHHGGLHPAADLWMHQKQPRRPTGERNLFEPPAVASWSPPQAASCACFHPSLPGSCMHTAAPLPQHASCECTARGVASFV